MKMWRSLALAALLTAPSARAAPTVEDPAEDAAAAEPIDVIVEGDKQPGESTGAPAETPVKRRDIERLPGAFGDAFRAVEVLPGVAPMATGLPHLFVRGANPSATGYFLDRIRVPFLFHLAIGPSVVNPAIVEDLTFYPGAYPASFGRHTGGIVNATTREPGSRLRAEGVLRLFDAGGYLEAPLFAEDMTVFVGARYSYTAPLLSLIAPDTSLEYWDYQAGAAYRLSSRERVGLFAFGSSDHLAKVHPGGGESELFSVRFHRLHAYLEQGPGVRAIDGMPDPMGSRVRLGMTMGVDRSGLGVEGVLDSRSYGLTVDTELPVVPSFRVRAGLDLLAERIDFDGLPPVEEVPIEDDEDKPAGGPQEEFNFDITRAFGSRSAGTVGGYLDLVWQPHWRFQLVPGFRFDLYAEDAVTVAAPEPRGQLRFRPTRAITAVTGVGLMHQRPTLLVPVPGLDPKGLDRGLQQAVQASQGVEVELPDDIRAGATGFYHAYSGLTDLTATCTASVKQCSVADRAEGRAFGLELSVRRSFSNRVGVLVAYTLSRSERRFQNETTLADFDRTHVFNLALGVDLGSHWHAAGRLMGYSGRPYSLLAIDDPDKPNEPTLVGKRNVLRRDGFVRVDLRLEKRWVIGGKSWVGLVLELLNATFQKETVDFDCRVAEVLGSSAGLSCGGQDIGPISIPSIGVSGGI